LVLGVTGSHLLAAASASSLVFRAATPAAGRNEMTLRRNGASVELLEGATGRVLTRAAREATQEIVVYGSAGDDTLTIDFSNGNPIPSGGVTFDGGDQTTREGDALVLRGGSFRKVTYDYANAHDGSVILDGSLVRYRGLEPIMNTGTVSDVVFNLPSGAPNVAQLKDNGTLGDGMSQLASSGTFETTNFTNPTGSLTINLGSMGDHLGICCGFDSGAGAGQFSASIIVNGGAGNDTVSVAQDLAIAGSLTLSGETVNIAAAAITTGGSQTYNGPISAIGPPTTTLASTGSGNVTFNGLYSGLGRNLVVNTAGVTAFQQGVQTGSLVTDAPGSTTMIGVMESQGAQTFGDPVTLTGNVGFQGDLAGASVTLPNTVSSAGPFSIALSGMGTLNLLGANTYLGGTLVNAGTLFVNNTTGSGTGTGTIQMNSGGTISGTGSTLSMLALQPGSTLAPGNAGIGALAVGNFNWTGGATAAFDLSNVDSSSDQVVVAGAFSKFGSPPYTFDFQGTGHAAVYTLATFTSTTFAVGDFSYTNLAPTLAGTFSIVGNTLQFTVGVVPVELMRFEAE